MDFFQICRKRYKPANNVPYAFVTKSKGNAQPISVRAIQTWLAYIPRLLTHREMVKIIGKSLSPHKLRHTFASEWIRKGGN
jgi:site-specific recombinase XerD